MLELEITKQFRKDISKIRFSNKHYAKYILFLGYLLEENEMPVEASDHSLEGVWSEYREFHVSGDLLVIYKISEGVLYLARIGTHSQLFK